MDPDGGVDLHRLRERRGLIDAVDRPSTEQGGEPGAGRTVVGAHQDPRGTIGMAIAPIMSLAP